MSERRRMPTTRMGRTHKVTITDPVVGDVDLYVTANYYEDGALGECFLSVGKQGGTLQGMLDSWAILLSVALQHGAELPALVAKFSGTSFSPSGRTDDPKVPQCSSILDYVMRYLVASGTD